MMTDAQRQSFRLLSFVVPLVMVLVVIYSLNYKQKQNRIEESRRIKTLVEEAKTKALIKDYILKGESLLNEEKYYDAKRLFYNAYLLDETNEDAFFWNLKAYMTDCVENNVDCSFCEYFVEQAEEEFGSEILTEKFGNLFAKWDQKRMDEYKIGKEYIVDLLNLGYKSLEKKKIKAAAEYFNKAYFFDNDYYYCNIAILRISLEECLQNNNFSSINIKLDDFEDKFGNTADLMDLKELYCEYKSLQEND